jgi:hypothetical protein
VYIFEIIWHTLFSQHHHQYTSINIAGPDHGDFFDVLFHFNPRQRERGGQVVINDKQQGIWGQGINIPLSQLPLMFGQVACTLVIQINGDGFDVFLEGVHCARLEHRKQLPSGKFTLFLQFPSTDDYGNSEVWTVYKVWWGNKSIMAGSDLSSVAGVNVFSTMHPVRFCKNRKGVCFAQKMSVRKLMVVIYCYIYVL